MRRGTAISVAASAALAGTVAAWLHLASLPPQPLPIQPTPQPFLSQPPEPEPEPEPEVTSSTSRLLTMPQPFQPVTYSWRMAGEDETLDACTLRFRSPVAVTASVDLYYRRGDRFVRHSIPPPTSWSAGQERAVERKVPSEVTCPCIVCVTQACPGGYDHAQCGVVVRPGEAMPSTWTPFAEMARGVVPCYIAPRFGAIHSDGFESGTLKAWG